MKLVATSMFDRVTNSYSDIKLYVNEEHAKREHCALLNSVVDKPVIKDIQIFRVGYFNTDTGEFEPSKDFIANATEVLEYGKE